MKPTNPFKRLRTEANLTQQGLAQVAMVSKQLIIRTEQGCFAGPPPVLIEFFTHHYGITSVELEEEYEDFQRAVRDANPRLLGIYPSSPSLKGKSGGIESRAHPFNKWRSMAGLNVTQVSKGLCVSQATLHRFESKPMLQQSVPGTLLSALLDNGYTNEELLKFQSDYEYFRNSKRVTPRAG